MGEAGAVCAINGADSRIDRQATAWAPKRARRVLMEWPKVRPNVRLARGEMGEGRLGIGGFCQRRLERARSRLP
ncbi:hypothetical protein GCM10009107_45840 [Ideonella azotifigens]|uniref:Uncharacterized protein n=1 Tax=Ideonella azotifigens TaxID=513160 RepID=A0ABN1KCG7_9BURK